MKDPKIVLLIFVSGKVVLTGEHILGCRGRGAKQAKSLWEVLH
jgi:TATA-box binding protein (TBP) (component of TFIID and TFIIIB)